MYQEFYNLRETETKKLLKWIGSEAYLSRLNNFYKPSEYWQDLKRRTFVGINTENVLLYSGHNFTYSVTSNKKKYQLLTPLAKIKLFRKLVNKIYLMLFNLKTYLDNYEKFDSKNIFRKYYTEEIPEWASKIMNYNAPKVYDTLENRHHLLQHFKKTISPIIFELGAGAGLTSLALLNELPNAKIIICDLPETISVAYVLISYFSKRNLKILLPSDLDKCNGNLSEAIKENDLLFITPNQIEMVPDNSIDLAINVHSMQEMDLSTITNYFHLLQRVGSKGSIFFCKNLKCSKQYDTTQIEKYPWHMFGKLIYEEVAPYASQRYPEGGNIIIKIVEIKS
ncbi:MAG: hypothetical protein A3J72_01545 [Nitrospirae bacterium RIFCSPHIGHO2_02_FULL_40_19]|nr:MAG: hypothetical protein A3J72_01545 [Nitrospirae bacterium RIFCSPHIGHO2_02_FULL_40_19]